MTKSSAQLEREADQTRAELAATLEELRTRITPGQLLDQTFAYARESNVGAFVRNLGRDARDNPLPLVIMGAGLAWLIMADGRRRAAGDFGQGYVDAARNPPGAIGGTVTRARGTEEGPADWAADGRSISEGASAMLHRNDDGPGAAARTRSAVSKAAERASGVYRNASAAGGSFLAFCEEHPVALAGIGLALGALLSAALPSTRRESADTKTGPTAAEEGLGDFHGLREASALEGSVVPAVPREHAEP